MKKISPTRAIVIYSVALIVVIIAELCLFDQPGDPDVILLSKLAITVALVAIVIPTMILHCRCWKAVPEKIARTSPGMAVGLLFVPFFNFYWVYVSYMGLAEDSAKALGRPPNARGLGITLGIFFNTSMLILLPIPLINSLLLAVYFVVWVIYTLKIVSAANELIGRQSSLASQSAEQDVNAAAHPA